MKVTENGVEKSLTFQPTVYSRLTFQKQEKKITTVIVTVIVKFMIISQKMSTDLHKKISNLVLKIEFIIRSQVSRTRRQNRPLSYCFINNEVESESEHS